MGIYNSKFKLESAVDDVIQTPDDVGADLEAIEKAIAGDDGIEGHIEDIEAAKSGVVGDPLEEAYEIMFESEYNWNQIMYCIGMHELKEASYGRELIYEAADSKGFFTKVKELFQSMFAGVMKAITNVLAKLDFQAKNDKKFVTDNADAIRRGISRSWTYSGYVFNVNRIHKFERVCKYAENTKDVWYKNIRKALYDIKNGSEDANGKMSDIYEEIESNRAKSILHVSGISADSVEDMIKKLTAELYGEKKDDLHGEITADFIISTLTSDRDTKSIREAYKSLKKSYNETISTIEDWEKDIDANYASISNALTICSHAVNTMKFEKNVLNHVFTVYMKAARANRSQTRDIAHKLVDIIKKEDKKKSTVQHNSAMFGENSVFGSIKLV